MRGACEFLRRSDLGDEMIDAYIQLRMAEVERFEMPPHPVVVRHVLQRVGVRTVAVGRNSPPSGVLRRATVDARVGAYSRDRRPCARRNTA